MMLLQELRYVCSEVGSLSDARSMPREVRQWWIRQMQKDEAKEAGNQPMAGPRVVVKDMPMGPRGGQ